MSKFVKQLVTDHLKNRLKGVNDLFLVSMVGMDGVTNSKLRGELREKNIQMVMIKNSLGRRACEGTVLAPAFENPAGMLALVWGSNDVVSLAKELVKVTSEKQYAQLEPKGGVVDGAAVSAADIKLVSKWPSREEQLSILLGQILSPGAMLASQLTSAGAPWLARSSKSAKARPAARLKQRAARAPRPLKAAPPKPAPPKPAPVEIAFEARQRANRSWKRLLGALDCPRRSI